MPAPVSLLETSPLGPTKVARAAGTGASVPVEYCQVCGHAPLDVVLSLGYMPPVNKIMAGSTARPICTSSHFEQWRRLVGNQGCWCETWPIGTIWFTGGM